MVTILPPKLDIGAMVGQGLGQGLSKGIEQGSNVAFQRGLLQNALKGLENLPKGTTPFQLASSLMQATAGIPGSERYVGQLFPLLLNQLRSEQAFGQQGEPSQFGGQFPSQQEGYAPTAQSLTPSSQQRPGGAPGGILGSVIPQDQIDAQSNRYAQATGTGLEGYNQMQQNLMSRNQIALQQRKMAEQKALDIGISQEDVPAFMQLGQKHKNDRTLDDWVRDTNRDFKEYKNLSKSLDSVSYPGFVTGLLGKAPLRESRLKELDKTVGRLVNLGFEQEVRSKLSQSGLSPTEIEERIHPFSDQTKMELNKLPIAAVNPFGPVQEKNDDKVKDFISKNVDNNTSLLALRQRLWQDKGYDWQKIAQLMNETLDHSKLTAAQLNELGILEREPPRQSLNYIFRDWGNFLQRLKGQK